jgi:hypothetical protein
MTERTSRACGDSRQANPYPQRPEIHLRRAGQQQWALVDEQSRTIVANGSSLEPVRR